MARNHLKGIAQSRYRQLRVTLTQETSGRLSVSLYAKGLDQAWQEQSCLDRWVVDYPEPVLTAEDAAEALVHALCERRLPGIG